MIKTNYHTHTNFCDGKGSPEEIITSAIEKGFSVLGLSSHSMYPFASTWHIAPRDFQNYVQAVKDASEKYSDKIEVLTGFEADYIPGHSVPSFKTYKSLNPDYLIGSVHYVFTEKGRLCVDYSAPKLFEKINELFDGNIKKLTCEYFSLQREMLKKGDFSILGHADLIRKNNGALKMFTEKESWYRSEIKATAKEIAKAGVIVEINTGAMARGYMDDVYPSSEFLSLLYQYNVPVTLSSDCHDPALLDFGFEKALQAAKNAGYSELAVLHKNNKIDFQKITD